MTRPRAPRPPLHPDEIVTPAEEKALRAELASRLAHLRGVYDRQRAALRGETDD